MIMYAIGNDHTGVALKQVIKAHLESKGIEVKDFGTQSTTASNYAEVAEVVANAVSSGECERAVLICGTGVGISIAANKVNGIRACCCSEPFSAKLSKMHNDSNILCFGARVVGTELAKMIVDCWVDAEYEYDLEVENEDRWGDEGFAEWINENAEELAREDAKEKGKTFEEIDRISFETESIDFDEAFDNEYANYADFERDMMNDR